MRDVLKLSAILVATIAAACRANAPLEVGGTGNVDASADVASPTFDCRPGPLDANGARACLPTIIVPPTTDCDLRDLVLANGVLYWTDSHGGTVESARIDGSARRTIARGETRPTALAVSDSSVLWVATNPQPIIGDGGAQVASSIRKLVLPGGAPTDLVAEVGLSPGIGGLALSDDGRTLYYVVDHSVKAVPVAGGAAVVVAEDVGSALPAAPAVEGTTLVYSHYGNGYMHVVSLADGATAMCIQAPFGAADGTNCARLPVSDGPPFLMKLLLKGGKVYWATGALIKSSTVGWPMGEEAVASASSQRAIIGFAGGRDGLYFADFDLIERVSYEAGTPSFPLAQGQTPTGPIVVDETRVYWANSDCSIAAVEHP